MSLAAPLIAAFIHSICVFERGIRLYNAEIGGIYFHNTPPNLRLREYIFTIIGACCAPALLTFLALLPFRKRILHRWLIWSGFIVLWTWVLFEMEIAIK